MSIIVNEAISFQALCFHPCDSNAAKKNLQFGVVPFAECADEGVRFSNDGVARFRLCYTSATSVELLINGARNALSRGDGSVWSGEVSLAVGFHYLFVFVDGMEVMSPYLPIGYGYGRPTHYVDVPPPSAAAVTLPYLSCGDNVPRGSICSLFMPSAVSGRTERVEVYMPPSYHSTASSTSRRYPVLFLQHGLGENETGWLCQGRLHYIADNLIHAGAAREVIIVMIDGMVPAPQADAEGNPFGIEPLRYADLLKTELIPFVESQFRVESDRAHRAVAGLSMGSMQAFCAAARYPELFSAVGLLSGFMRSGWSGIGPRDGADAHLDLLRQPGQVKRFHDNIKLLFRAIGSCDPMRGIFEEDDAIVQELGLQEVRKVYEGYDHTWQVWRLAIAELLPLLFQQ